jgi:hypothetical protein
LACVHVLLPAIKILLVKYIYKKTTNNKKIDVIKKSYHSLHMRKEHNGAASVRGNGIVNMLVLLIRTGL